MRWLTISHLNRTYHVNPDLIAHVVDTGGTLRLYTAGCADAVPVPADMMEGVRARLGLTAPPAPAGGDGAVHPLVAPEGGASYGGGL